MATKKKDNKKTELEKLKDFGKFLSDINTDIGKTVEMSRKKIAAESNRVGLDDLISGMLGLRPQTQPTTAQRAKKPARKATVRRKNGS